MSRQQRRIVESHLNIAYNHLRQDDYDAAIACFNKLLELDPSNPDYYFERGMAYRRKALFDRSNSQRNTQEGDLFDQSNLDLEEAIRLYEQEPQ